MRMSKTRCKIGSLDRRAHSLANSQTCFQMAAPCSCSSKKSPAREKDPGNLVSLSSQFRTVRPGASSERSSPCHWLRTNPWAFLVGTHSSALGDIWGESFLQRLGPALAKVLSLFGWFEHGPISRLLRVGVRFDKDISGLWISIL